MITKAILGLALSAALFATLQAATPVSTSFTYQG